MSKEVKDEPKKRGHRKKKFGSQESKVISFRIGKDIYNKNKKAIREKINTVIESESINKQINRIEPKKTKEIINNDIKKNKEVLKETVEVKEEVFVIDQEVYEQRDYIKEFVNKEKPEQPQEDVKNVTNSNGIIETKKRDAEEIIMVDELYTIHNYRDIVDKDKEKKELQQI
ncbi:hypothetical protein LCGC14_1277520 [marine sediment metagenome]|uniref:Uncharacterized protein n=1 Tax=marine sediment metagenome TaxID=412755 RepID=A0A0F9NCT7_9ZZZZ|nr:hypothetical protein [bacterium]